MEQGTEGKERAKAAIYLRVSKKDQHTENQELALQDYCKAQVYQVYQVYVDIITGATDSRPGLDSMLQDMRKGLFQVIVVWKYDRMGRSTKHLLQVLEEIQNRNVRLIATTQGIDTGTPIGKFFYTIIAGFAELEREQMIERVNLAVARAKKEGKSWGRPKGSTDKKPRNRLGYWKRYSKTK
jgi:DNA invertase Pin-like site-specific DNA recombinase